MCASVQQIYHISLPSLEKTQIVPFPHPPIDEYCYVFYSIGHRSSSFQFVSFVLLGRCVWTYINSHFVYLQFVRVCVCARECLNVLDVICDQSAVLMDLCSFCQTNVCVCSFGSIWSFLLLSTQWINRKYNNFSDNFNWLIIINCEFSVPILRWLSPPLNEFIISTTRSSVIDLPLAVD